MLFIVSSLDKQDLILGYPWLKNHNPEVNQNKRKVKITCCLPKYDSCRDIQKAEFKARRVEEYMIGIYQSGPFSWISKENKKLNMTIEYKRLDKELGNRVFLIHIILEKSPANIQVITTTSQRLSKVFQKSTIAVDKKPLLLSSYT